MRSLPVILSAFVVLSLGAPRAVRGEEGQPGAFSMSSSAFSRNGMIPQRYTCDGADVSPPLSIGSVPKGAKSLALIVDDPDAPWRTFVHWIVWNIAPDTREVPGDRVPPGALQGTNDFGARKYGGPCPPSGTHRYFFRLYALDGPLHLKAGATRAQVEKAMEGRLLGKTELVGLYRRR